MKTTTQAVTIALTKAGFKSHKTEREHMRNGFKVRKLGSFVGVIAWHPAIPDYTRQIEAALLAAGFTVGHPEGWDTAALKVTR